MTVLHHIPQRMSRILPGEEAMKALKGWLTRVLIRFLFFAYTLFILKPVMPIIMDVLAHAFWENVHIAVVHRVNGKEHVHYELRKMAAESEKDKAGIKHKSLQEDSYSLPDLVLAGNTAYCPSSPAKPEAYYQRAHEDAGISLDFPPPKLV